MIGTAEMYQRLSLAMEHGAITMIPKTTAEPSVV